MTRDANASRDLHFASIDRALLMLLLNEVLYAHAGKLVDAKYRVESSMSVLAMCQGLGQALGTMPDA